MDRHRGKTGVPTDMRKRRSRRRWGRKEGSGGNITLPRDFQSNRYQRHPFEMEVERNLREGAKRSQAGSVFVPPPHSRSPSFLTPFPSCVLRHQHFICVRFDEDLRTCGGRSLRSTDVINTDVIVGRPAWLALACHSSCTRRTTDRTTTQLRSHCVETKL